MDNPEAIALLEQELDTFRGNAWSELVGRIDLDPVICERLGAGGTKYQLEIQCVWDARRGGDVRVIGTVDDGGWRAFAPVTRAFIKSADGSFVNE